MGEEGTPAVVCLGFFDGVHRGHQALLSAARAQAAEKKLCVCVHTFDHAPGSKGFELTPLAEREALLRRYGADWVAVSIFNEEMRKMPGDAFFQSIVLEKLNARHVVCGDDHRFGYRGAWGVNELSALCERAGVGLTVVPPVTLPDGRRISSTAIRAALLKGDWALAAEMLGRPVPEEMKRESGEAIATQ